MSLQQAAEVIAQAHQTVTCAAQAQADELLGTARAQADGWLAEAQAQREAGYQAGLRQGAEEAAVAWTRQALAGAQASQTALDKQRERLGNIVALAVERLVEQEDRQALFKKALRTIGKLVKDVPLLTLRVHSGDHDAARKALLEVMDQLADAVPIEVVADAALASGSCRFESDQGVIDASLSAQLSAIRRAVARVAHDGPAEPEPAAVAVAPCE